MGDLSAAAQKMQNALSNWSMVNAITDPHLEAAAWAQFMAARSELEATVIDEKLKYPADNWPNQVRTLEVVR